jgi:hypothetical protein
MVCQSDCDERRHNRTGAQDPPPSSPLQRVGIDESIWSRRAKPQNVAVLERLPAANPPAIEKRAARGFEIDRIVFAVRISDDRVTICDARIRDSQRRPFRAANLGFIALEEQQPRAGRFAIDRQQTCGLRP